jgi:hypothetical protein
LIHLKAYLSLMKKIQSWINLLDPSQVIKI